MQRDISLHKTSLCGMRQSNEDVEVYCMNLTTNGFAMDPNFAPIDLFIICDGHGGAEVANFVAPKLRNNFMRKNLKYPLDKRYIKQIYNYVQQSIINHPHKIGKNCGSTALVLIRYIDNTMTKNIQVINLGDCRGILCRRGMALPLTIDHKPSCPYEKMRIDRVNILYKTNEEIDFHEGDWRIGDLSVSRAFGDEDNTPYVTHIPDVFCYKIHKDDEFIVLSCDGLTEKLQNQEIVEFVRDHLNKNNIKKYNINGKYPTKEIANQKNIARKLAEYAIAKGSTDNVSILIIFF